MATKTKRKIAIPAALWKDLNQLARREGTSMVRVIEGLVSEKRQNQLKQEFRALQSCWSKKAKSIARKMESKIETDPDVLLARARAVRRIPKGIRLSDQLLHSLRKKLKGMKTDNLREKQDRIF